MRTDLRVASVLATIVMVLAVLGLIASRSLLAEERLVAARYPEYTAYAARTARIIPRVL